jgi:hypothetical protein
MKKFLSQEEWKSIDLILKGAKKALFFASNATIFQFMWSTFLKQIPYTIWIPNGRGFHILDDEWIQACLLNERTCWFHWSKLIKIFILVLKDLCTIDFKTPLYKYSIAQRVQVYLISKTNFFNSKHDPSKTTSINKHENL